MSKKTESSKEKIEKMKQLLKAITEQNKITAEFLTNADFLKAKESVNHTDTLINELHYIIFL